MDSKKMEKNANSEEEKYRLLENDKNNNNYNHTASSKQGRDHSSQKIRLPSSDFRETIAEMSNFEGLITTDFQKVSFFILVILSGGIIGLFAFWFPNFRKSLLYTTAHLSTCSLVIVTYDDESSDIIQVNESIVNGKNLRWIDARCQRLVYDKLSNSFIAINDIADKFTKFLAPSYVLSSEERDGLVLTYGLNVIDIPVPAWSTMFLLEAFKPFYVFQYASVIIWTIEDYWTYSIVIFVITMAAIILNVQETHKNKLRLHDMSAIDMDVDCLSPDPSFPRKVHSSSLVPGDRILIKSNQILPCDAVLVQGECIVDESILTGESMPVRKTPFRCTDEEYDPVRHASFTLFSGTSVKLAQGGSGSSYEACVEVVVCRTGFRSAKGQLIRAIMFPMEHKLLYTEDAMKFILFMAVFGSLFYIWCAVELAQYGSPPSDIVLKFFDMITICVPPALAASLTIATSVAISRLQDRQVFVSDNSRVNWAGLVTAVCFDKTGTLTESGLGFHGIVVSTAHGGHSRVVNDVSALPSAMIEMMATCHSLSLLNGTLVGDPLEQRMLEATGWIMSQTAITGGFLTTFTSSSSVDGVWRCMRRFDFSSNKMRSGVIIQRPDDSKLLITKGSPETMKVIMLPDSIPDDFDEVLGSFARQGLRVIAIASREIQSHEDFFLADQSVLEYGLVYRGLILLENKLKPESKATIEVLLDANLKVVMITGDHIRTAISVSYGCSILSRSKRVVILDASVTDSENCLSFTITECETGIDEICPQSEAERLVAIGECELAITGRALRVVASLFPDLASFVLRYGNVFARMDPDDKRYIVEGLSIGSVGSLSRGYNSYYVAYCGDGANDIAALKSAMVGVSLCDAEASVAAPLTSRQQTPSIMPRILIEGRCSLVTSFVLFKYIMVYAFIQVFGTALMYTMGLIVGNYQYLIQDLFFTTVLAITISVSQSSDTLSAKRPPDRFMSLQMVIPVVTQFAVVAAFQFLSIQMMSQESWYTKYEVDDGNNSPLTETYEYETSAIFGLSLAQFMIAAIVLDVGAPFRQAWYKNKYMVIALSLQLGILLYVVLSGPDDLKKSFFEFKSFPVSYRFKLLGLMAADLIVTYALDFISRWCCQAFFK